MRELKTAEEIKAAMKLVDAWKHPDMPERQWQMNEVAFEAADKHSWRDIWPYRALDEALHLLPYDKDNALIDLLEIGASNAINSVVIKKAGYNYNYFATDYSEPFRKFARAKYPNIKYYVEDARKLHWPDFTFPIVLSGSCLLHIPEWTSALYESARVSSNFVIFHKTPILNKKNTTWYVKEAYGVECVELHFNRGEFYDELHKAGLVSFAEIDVYQNATPDYGMYTIVCRKR